MAGLVQRVPAGLLQVLNAVSGGENPRLIGEQVSGVLDLLQFYGLSQRTNLTATNAALAEGATLGIVLPNSWCVMYGIEFQVTKTATLTALSTSISLQRNAGASSSCVSDREYTAFGATVTGVQRHGWFAEYPVLMPPGSVIIARADIIGTDATVSAGLITEIGVLG
jgi:hypothetical protein